MLDNTRAINKESLDYIHKHLAPDAHVIYDQCFTESDFHPDYTYIAHADKRMGWVAARNGLLEWFYKSDYDYAFWIDANSKVTTTTLNDVTTILDALRDNKFFENHAFISSSNSVPLVDANNTNSRCPQS